MTLRTIMLAAVLAAIALPALAADIFGDWLRDNGASHVRFAKCGDLICGTVVWLRDADSPAKLGEKVFFDMKATGTNTWSGQAFNPEDGKTYTGKMTLDGDTLTTEGCIFGGLLCKSATWTRL